MRPHSINQLKGELQVLLRALTDFGRLNALAALAHPVVTDKLRYARGFYETTRQAILLEELLYQKFQVKKGFVAWSADCNPRLAGVLTDGSIEQTPLRSLLRSVRAAISNHAILVRPALDATEMLSELRQAVGELIGTSPELDGIRLPFDQSPSGGEAGEKVVRGPSTLGVDPAFTPSYSLLNQPSPSFGSQLHEAAPYYWTLSLREAFASDVCALSAVECDYLPLQFYADMAKQCWDEVRHARFYFDFSVSLFGPLLSQLPASSPLAAVIRNYHDTGSGLPIPTELNFYHTFLDATLAERLILMQVRTETPAIKRLGVRLQSELAAQHPDLAQAIEIDRCDEKSHSRIGWSWLRFLFPDPVQRRLLIERTDLLRSLFILLSVSHTGGGTMGELLSTFSGTSSHLQDAPEVAS
jgi:hypothetical protein